MTARPTQFARILAFALSAVCLAGLAGLAAADDGQKNQPSNNKDQNMEPCGFLSKTIDIDGTTYRYVVYVPAGYSTARKWPVILFMHGSGERGSDGLSHLPVSIAPHIMRHPERFPCLVVMPQCRPNQTWHQDVAMQKLAMGALAATEKEYSTDPDRVVCTGLSLGGFGTWTLGAMFPERFSALGPICGVGNPDNAAALAMTPTWVWHGDADQRVPVGASRQMVEAVRAAGGDVKYSELKGVGHNSWDKAYGDADFIKWMLEQKRE